MIFELRDLVLIPLGVIAGAMTTLAGLGGGLMMIAALSIVYDPKLALAITAPALLVGNLHRATMYRTFIDVGVAKRVATSGFVAALLFGWLAVRLPDALLRALLIGSTLFALGRATNTIRFTIRPEWLVPMGLAIGAITATSGGGPALLAPTLMASGLSGERYVSTASTCALCVHIGRVIAYGASGFLDVPQLARAGVLAICVLGGNAIGARLRPGFAPKTLSNLEVFALAVVAVTSLVGFGG